jgi:hypothetical protein
LEGVQNDPFQTEGFQRESFQCRFTKKRIPREVSKLKAPMKGLQRESFQREIKSESFQRQQPCFWTPSSESVCLSAASQSGSLQEAVHVDSVWGGFPERVAIERVSREGFPEGAFPGRVFRGRVSSGVPIRKFKRQHARFETAQ